MKIIKFYDGVTPVLSFTTAHEKETSNYFANGYSKVLFWNAFLALTEPHLRDKASDYCEKQNVGDTYTLQGRHEYAEVYFEIHREEYGDTHALDCENPQY
jgi:hypothetical protein